MSCFILPKGIYKQLETIISDFLWGSKQNEKKIHWIKWKKIIHLKYKEGLGFRDLRAFNEEILAKYGCRLISNPESL